MSRYGDISYVMNMDASDGVLLIREAYLEKDKEDIFKLYTSLAPHMGENYVPFEEFYKKTSGYFSASQKMTDEKQTIKTVEEVMTSVEDIFNNYSF